MNVSDEYKEILSSLRTEYAASIQIWRYLASARTLLLITASTVIGTVMNLYRTGLASFKTAQIHGTGQIVSVVSDIPTMTASVFAASLVGAVVVSVLVLDIVAGQIQTKIVLRGFILETAMSIRGGIFAALLDSENQIKVAFLLARGILFLVALSWVTLFFSISM